MQTSILRKSLGAYIAILLILVGLSGLFLQSYRELSVAAENRSISRETVITLSRTLIDLEDAESSQRGYLLTRDPRYLSHYEQMTSRLERNLDTLGVLVQGEPGQQEKLRELRLQATSRQAILSEIIRLYRVGRTGEGLARLKSGEDFAAMTSFQKIAADMARHEQGQVEQFDNALKHHMEQSLWIGGAFILLVVGLLCLLYHTLHREIRQREATERALNDTLERERLTRDMMQLISESFDYEAILHTIAGKIGEIMQADRCLVVQYNRHNGVFRPLCIAAQYTRQGIPPIRNEEVPWDQFESISHQSLYEQPLVFFKANEPSRFPAAIQECFRTHQVQSAFMGEIRYHDTPFGCLVLHQCDSIRHWTEDETSFLKKLMTQIGGVLYQAELYQSELRERQAAEKANREKTRILGFVSHDFKNPLNAMQWMLDILKREGRQIGNLTHGQNEALDNLELGVRQLRSMVVMILDQARLESGQLQPRPQPVHLPGLLKDLAALMKPLSEQKGIRMDWGVDDSVADLHADPVYLRQILLNLIGNAVKYNRPGGSIHIRVMPDSADHYARIDISDTGIGISPQCLNKLFEEYYRVDTSQSEKVEGTGLGLAFIKKLVELHGGTVTVQSREGAGSTFTVRLPLKFGSVYPFPEVTALQAGKV